MRSSPDRRRSRRLPTEGVAKKVVTICCVVTYRSRQIVRRISQSRRCKLLQIIFVPILLGLHRFHLPLLCFLHCLRPLLRLLFHLILLLFILSLLLLLFLLLQLLLDHCHQPQSQNLFLFRLVLLLPWPSHSQGQSALPPQSVVGSEGAGRTDRLFPAGGPGHSDELSPRSFGAARDPTREPATDPTSDTPWSTKAQSTWRGRIATTARTTSVPLGSVGRDRPQAELSDHGRELLPRGVGITAE